MTLEVDPAVLQGAGTAFGQAADGLAEVRADTPLNDAAAAMHSLQTSDACRATASEVTAEVTAAAADARQFSDNLEAAARWYENRDQAAADAINKIDIPD
jgi:hypothetical protein